ncbi:DUF3817 domain-containing protein [Actinocorallia sp. B10E7]|uniref:DUF3817 domain-containing protein n=1 Tax=Actinocorallia sp. B10E7 TaxID=3153558 RepID=UPI00325CB1AC
MIDKVSDRLLTRAFSVIAAVEAFTWAGLLIGMYFKYVPETTELGVKIFGPLHGGVFMLYGLLAILLAARLKWSFFWTTVLALVSAVPPFATVAFEVWARRTGRLTPPEGLAATPAADLPSAKV